MWKMERTPKLSKKNIKKNLSDVKELITEEDQKADPNQKADHQKADPDQKADLETEKEAKRRKRRRNINLRAE